MAIATSCWYMTKVDSIANVGDTLGGSTSLDGPSIADYVHDMKIELDLWFE